MQQFSGSRAQISVIEANEMDEVESNDDQKHNSTVGIRLN